MPDRFEFTDFELNQCLGANATRLSVPRLQQITPAREFLFKPTPTKGGHRGRPAQRRATLDARFAHPPAPCSRRCPVSLLTELMRRAPCAQVKRTASPGIVPSGARCVSDGTCRNVNISWEVSQQLKIEAPRYIRSTKKMCSAWSVGTPKPFFATPLQREREKRDGVKMLHRS